MRGARLRGLVTYGSPLDKFAYLWSQIVNINHDTAPWRAGNGERTVPFEWINVYDHTDPVSAGLEAYEGGSIPADSPKPVNLAYKASWVLLLSHLKYLALRRNGEHLPQDQFVLRLATHRSKSRIRTRTATGIEGSRASSVWRCGPRCGSWPRRS